MSKVFLYKIRPGTPELSQVPLRYQNAKFSLIQLVGDYGVFAHNDRKRPFILKISNLEKVN